MNLSEIFIRRPVMTFLIMISILFFGIVGYQSLPVSNLPSVAYPTIEVTTSYPGASPETMADTVTSPLERQFTSIDGIQMIASASQTGSSGIVLQFHLDKDIDAAAQDIQAAISRSTPYLPSDLPNIPTYRKMNPAESPVIYFSITSDAMELGELYEYAYSLMGRRFGMIDGVSDVLVYGSKSAVRIQLDPDRLAAHQIGIDSIANTIVSSNTQQPVGSFYGKDTKYTIDVEGQIKTAQGYNNLIIRNKDNAFLRLKDVGLATDSLQNDKYSLNYLTKDTKNPCVVIGIIKQPGANTIKVVDGVKKLIEKLQGELPSSITLHTLFDESVSIIESVYVVKFTLLIAFILVLIVVLFYLGKIVDTVIPIITLPLTIMGTFALMNLYGFSIDILSLLAITLSVGFLIDDAIVVLENISRHIEMGSPPFKASLSGSKQISLTIVSMTLSLIVVFIPMIFMAGIMGRIFQEFALTIITAVLISGFISLSLTPLLCSRLITTKHLKKEKNWLERISHKVNTSLLNTYKKGLGFVLKHQITTLSIGMCSFLGTLYLGVLLPKDFLPNDDLGFIQSFTLAQDSTSPFRMAEYQDQIAEIIRNDPNVEKLVSVSALPRSNQGMMFISLKPIKERKSMPKVVQGLTEKVNNIVGCQTFFKPMPLIDLDVGTESSMGAYQYSLQGVDSKKLYASAETIMEEMRKSNAFKQVVSNMHNKAPYVNVSIDRDLASNLNVSTRSIESAFGYAYSGGQISLINETTDQYHVILETIPSAYKDPSVLNKLYVSSDTGSQIPLASFIKWKEGLGPLTITHINTLPAVIISYDLATNVPLGTGLEKLNEISKPHTKEGIMTDSLGTADTFKSSFKSLIILLIVTIFLIYVILGILYENFIHPLSVMSSLPPAAFGAILTLLAFNEPLSLYAFVGIIMLLGIVLKNGIMLVEFANKEIQAGKSPVEAIKGTCNERFRPILMTTFAAMMGAVPIALGIGGLTAQSRKPLGLVIVGGLIISQILTLYFTPIVFLFFERLRSKFHKSSNL